MSAIFISTDIHEREPFISMDSASLVLWFQVAGWSAQQRMPGMAPDVAFKYFARRTWRRRIATLCEVGLLEPVDGKWFRIVREINGKPIWRATGPNTARPHIPTRVRRAVFERDGYACVTCGATERLSLDHIHPYSLGGGDTIDNLQAMCKSCNSRKGATVSG